MTSFNCKGTMVENADVVELQKKTNNAVEDGGERGPVELWTIT